MYDLKQVERDSTQTESRLKELEDDLVSGDVLRDTLRNDRSKVIIIFFFPAKTKKLSTSFAIGSMKLRKLKESFKVNF